jgi:hypothetical protein
VVGGFLKLGAPTDQERVRPDKQSVGTPAHDRAEGGFNAADAVGLDCLNQ